MRIFLPILLGVYFFGLVHTKAQQPDLECGQEAYERFLEIKYPGFQEARKQTNEKALKEIHDQRLYKINEDDTLYSMRIVFHVLYNNDRERLPESVVYNQLDIINHAYRHTHDDTGIVTEAFKPLAGDTRIQFELATEDPEGNPTTGINYVPTTREWFFGGLAGDRDEFMKFSDLGGVDVWDPKRYLNIWICDMANESGAVFTLGYARPPLGAANWPSSSFNFGANTDGVVLHYEIIGDPVLNANYETGSHTVIHEIGHYLGLRHTWGDAGNAAFGCNVDDGIEDTPNSRQANRGCNLFLNTCIDQSNDMRDNVENYMDYTSSQCSRMYTVEQREMMRYNLLRFRRGVATPILPEVPVGKYDTVDLKLDIFPNPASRELVVSNPDITENQIIRVQLHDMAGREVYRTAAELNRYAIIQIPSMANGLYVVSVSTDDRKRMLRRKIIIEQE